MPWRLFAVVVLLASGCAGQQEDLRSAQERWQQAGPARYAYTYRAGAQALVEARVTVRDGRAALTRVQGAELSADEVTVEALFDLVARALREADDVDVTYDDRYGFPARLQVDPAADTVDDEYTVHVRDLVVEPY